jgi:hypothetical protein
MPDACLGDARAAWCARIAAFGIAASRHRGIFTMR